MVCAKAGRSFCISCSCSATVAVEMMTRVLRARASATAVLA